MWAGPDSLGLGGGAAGELATSQKQAARSRRRGTGHLPLTEHPLRLQRLTLPPERGARKDLIDAAGLDENARRYGGEQADGSLDLVALVEADDGAGVICFSGNGYRDPFVYWPPATSRCSGRATMSAKRRRTPGGSASGR